MSYQFPVHLQSTVSAILSAPVEPPPEPWREVAVCAVGGLESVGFAPATDCLLVCSTQGRGVFDCVSGKRLARDDVDSMFDDPIDLEALGIGPLADKMIRTSGIHGGGLPNSTHDEWTAERFTLQWPEETLLLVPPGSWIYGRAYNKPAEFTKLLVDSEVRAYGFSPTGKSLVIATSNSLYIYGRE